MIKYKLKAIAMKSSQNQSLLVFVMICLLISTTHQKTSFQVYPLGEDYFEKIYLINHNQMQYYLTISCKEQNMLSISITTNRSFIEAPTFNIYGHTENRPKMARGVYTFLQECHSYVEVDTSNFLEVRRGKDGQTIFAMSDLKFEHLHNRFVVKDTSVKWGLGQRFQKNFHVVDGQWTIWNRDKPWKIDQGKSGLSDQTYGHHPIYLARQRQSKLYHLVYYKNTEGLLIQSSKNSDELLYHSVGGNIHFIIIIGQNDPQEVLQKYHQYIGRGHIPPFWSFGHHQCRWGYKSFQEIKQVVDKYNQNDIPLDTMWSDLQYMDRKMIFTINQDTHKPKNLNNLLKTQQLHFVPLIDVGVSINDREAMRVGKQMNVFFTNINDNDYYTAQVWPGLVHFVDYLHPNSSSFWKIQMKRLNQLLDFSGIWLDMNEPSNFRGGQGVSSEPFRIQQNENLNMMTINSDLKHYNQKNPKIPLKHKEVHAYYGHLSSVATYEYLNENKRPFIISRSTSVGSGHFVGHWTGDNVATWEFLRLSISGNFLFQIFGIQMVGADICGFYLSTTQQLCSRWHQIGAFYPFSRNHNHNQARSQQPYAFGKDLLETSRQSIKTRYALLRQLYSIYLLKKGKGSFYRPISFQFYNDQNAYNQEAIQTQILIGKYLMTTPIVYKGVDSRQVYFPGDGEEWYQFQIDSHTGKIIPEKINKFIGKSSQKIINQLPSAPPTFLRGGYALLTNYPENRSIKLNNQYNLFATLKNGESFVSILGIQNYSNEANIKKCISDNCVFHIRIISKEDSYFTISWTYQGDKQAFGYLKIKSVIIINSTKKWKSDEPIQLKTISGQFKFKAEPFV